MSSHIKTERSWFIIFFGACFAMPAVLVFAMSIVPRLQVVSDRYPPSWKFKMVLSEVMGNMAMEVFTLLILTIVGLGIMYWGWRGTKVNRDPEALNKPWLAKPEWMHNRIISFSKSGVYVTGFFALAWNLFSWPMAYFKLPEVYQEESLWIAALLGLFPIIGLFVFYLFVKNLKQWVRFGSTPLILDPFPGSIGGQVGGIVEIATPMTKRDTYKVTLSCIKKYFTRSGSERRLQEQLIWHKENYAKLLSRGAKGSALSFRFDVPKGLPASDIEQGEQWHVWRVQMEASKASKGGFDRYYEIPVFTTQEQSSIQADIPTWQKENEDKKLIGTYLPIVKNKDQYISEESQSNKEVIHYPMFYRPANKLFFLAFGAVFAGVGMGIWDDSPAFMSIIFGLTGGLITLASLYYLFSSLTVTIDPQGVSSTRHFMGGLARTHKIRAANIERIESKEVMRSQSAGKHSVYYEVFAALKVGKKVLLAQQIEGERAVNLVIKHFNERLGLRA